MRIISLNAWGGQVWDSLAPWVQSIDPDVLCLQEVTRAPVPSPDWLIYKDAFRHLDQRADLFGDVCSLLPDHQNFFAPAVRGALLTPSGEQVASEHGLGLWVRKNLAVTAMTQAFIHGAYRSGGWGQEPVPRTMQVVRVFDTDTQRDVTIGHLHGLRHPEGKHDTPARARQTDKIVEIFGQMWSTGASGVLAGDFNLLPDSACFADLSRLGLINLIAHHGITDTRTQPYKKTQRFADYMLVSPDLTGAGFSVPAEPVVSDHRALVLTI